MPELPEVETMVRGIRPTVLGQTVEHVRLCPCECRPIALKPAFPEFAKQLRGRTIVDAHRLAKRVILSLDDHRLIAIEPRMTGLMLVADPPDEHHLRLEWQLNGPTGSTRVWFWDRRGLGTVTLLESDQIESVLGPSRLGPDALEMTSELWKSQLGRTSRPIKVALLDQRLVAGIGNLYASEILHRAQLSPRRRADRLTKNQRARIAEATREILLDAIRYEGSTLGDGTYRNALNQDGSYQNQHRVYARTNETCETCRTGRIRRIVQAQRSTFYCPVCQR